MTGRVAFLSALLLFGFPETGRAGAVSFSRLTPCPDAGRLVFQAVDPDAPRADTLCLDPGTGRLSWLGGPVRGLASGGGDTVYAATLAGAAILTPGGEVGFAPWVGRFSTLPAGSPRTWPPSRARVPRDRRSGGVPVGEVVVFPERYQAFADGSLVFLIDAEHPPKPGLPLYDLHSRSPDGVEWMLRRNLEVRRWVLSPDSLHWAAAVREHRPDYGGQVRETLLAGRGHEMEAFEIGPPSELLWDRRANLWARNRDGDLFLIRPGPPVWTISPAGFAPDACPCTPGDPESVWVWVSPGRYRDRAGAWRTAEGVREEEDADAPRRAWVVRDERGDYRPVWGGHFSEETLRNEIQEPPIPGAVPARVPVRSSAYVGTTARVVMPPLSGEAAIRRVKLGGEVVSELWWRYLTKSDWVLLAGPWGAPAPGPPHTPPAVDTPRGAP